MPSCWMVHQLLLVMVLKGTLNEGFFGNLGSYRSENYAENDFHIEFNPSAVLAFVPARSCHSQLSGDHGTFSPPVFYGNINVYLWCNWTVLAAPGKHIVIYITGFRTNESCYDNLDEIIFEGISSSIETSIVYACWNKHTHVFATEASAVNVVLLWRSFSNIGSKRYFEGRYYIFDDPVFGPSTESGNCSLNNKQNISTSDAIQGSYPDKRLTTESYLYSVFPESSSSKRVKSSIHLFPEVHYPQGPPTLVETDSPTSTIDHLPTTTPDEDDMLPVTQTLAQNLSTIDNKFDPQLPVLTQSLDLSVYKGPTVQPIAEDLEPSQVVKWKQMSYSEFVSETPNLISTHSTELLEVDQHSAVLSHSLVTSFAEMKYVSTIHVGELHSVTQMSPYSSPTRLQETPQVNTTHTVEFHETFNVGKSNVPENQHLSRDDFEPPRDLQFITTLAPDPPEPSLVHIFHTDFPEPSLLSDLSHSGNIHTTKTSQLNMDQTSERARMPSFHVTQILNVSVISSIEFQETLSLRLTEYFEPTVLNVSTVHHIDLMEMKPLYATDIAGLSELPKSVTNKMVHTIGQSVGLNTAKSAHLLMLSIRIESNPKEPVSEYPWQVESSHSTPHPDSLIMSPLQSSSFTEAHTSVLHSHFFPLQVSEQPSLPNYESTLHPHFTPSKTLHNVVAGKTEVADPENLESFTTSLVPTSSTASPITSPKTRTSVLDFQIVHPTYWTTIEQPQDPVTPQSTVVTPDQQLMLESSLAFHPIPKVPPELIYTRSALQITEKIDKMVPVTEYMIVTDYRITRSLVEPTKVLDRWTIKDNLEATDTSPRIPIHPISTPVSHLKTKDITTDNMELDMDITTKELISAGYENSTYSFQTESDLDLQQTAAGQPRGGYLDEEDGTYFFGNQSDFTLDHKPGDSLFVITTEIENKDDVSKVFQEDLVQSVRDKITERMIYFPGGGNSLILKEFRWINVNRVKLTFWLQLNQGGKGMINFLKTQLKALENYPLGSSSATLISFTVEDVNECHLGIHKCHINAVCDNRIGSYTCTCMDGYEDHSATVAGTMCIYSKLAEIHSLSEHMEILIGVIVTVAVTLLLIIIILCVMKHKRQVKVDFSLQDPSIIEHGACFGGDRHGKFGQPPSSQARHLPPRHGREHHTARDTASTLELTRITVEQATC